MYFAAIFALPAAFGARAAFYAEPLSDILGPAVTVVVYFLAIGKVFQLSLIHIFSKLPGGRPPAAGAFLTAVQLGLYNFPGKKARAPP